MDDGFVQCKRTEKSFVGVKALNWGLWLQRLMKSHVLPPCTQGGDRAKATSHLAGGGDVGTGSARTVSTIWEDCCSWYGIFLVKS